MDCKIGQLSKELTKRPGLKERPPGDQAQFDWSEYSMLIGDRERKVYCFAMILAASRKKAVCFSLKSDAPAIYEAIQELYEDLGGVTLELLIDNPKALVIENNPKSEEEIRYNPQALLLAKHLGTELNACPYYWPRKKGKILYDGFFYPHLFRKEASSRHFSGISLFYSTCLRNQHLELRIQCLRNPLKSTHRWICYSPFNFGNIGLVDPCRFGKLFL